jgi:hypothetical protein
MEQNPLIESAEPKPETPQPICAHCHQPLTEIGWLANAEVGLFTFYHNSPECMVALNCQLVPVERRVEPALPNLLRRN